MSRNSQCSVESIEGSCSPELRQSAPRLVQSAGSCACGAAMHVLGSPKQLGQAAVSCARLQRLRMQLA